MEEKEIKTNYTEQYDKYCEEKLKEFEEKRLNLHKPKTKDAKAKNNPLRTLIWFTIYLIICFAILCLDFIDLTLRFSLMVIVFFISIPIAFPIEKIERFPLAEELYDALTWYFIKDYFEKFEAVDGTSSPEEGIDIANNTLLFGKVTKANIQEGISGRYEGVDFIINYAEISAKEIGGNNTLPCFLYTIKSNSKIKNLTYIDNTNKDKHLPAREFLSIKIEEYIKKGCAGMYIGETIDKDGSLNFILTAPLSPNFDPRIDFTFFEKVKINTKLTKEIIEESVLCCHINNIIASVNIMKDFETKTEEEMQREVELLKTQWKENNNK